MASIRINHSFESDPTGSTDGDFSTVLKFRSGVPDAVSSGNDPNELEKTSASKVLGDDNGRISPIDDELQQHYIDPFLSRNGLANIDEKHLSILNQMISRRGSVVIDTTEAVKPIKAQSLCGTTLYIAEWNIDVSTFFIDTRK